MAGMLLLQWRTACALAEMDSEPLPLDTFRGCFQFSCELSEKKNVSLGDLIGAALLTDVGVYYPTGTTFCSSELLIISEAQCCARSGTWLRAARGVWGGFSPRQHPSLPRSPGCPLAQLHWVQLNPYLGFQNPKYRWSSRVCPVLLCIAGAFLSDFWRAVPVFSAERPLDLGPECLILTSVRAAGRGELGIKAKRRSDGNLSWLQERWRSRL